MESEALRRSAEAALCKAWADEKGTAIFRPKPAGYLEKPEDNLVDDITLALFEDELNRAPGGELKPRKTKSDKEEPPKFCAAYSSSALVANTFAFFKRRPELLTVLGNNLSELCFEEPCPTGLGGTPPNLDVLIKGEESVMGIESKCTEYFDEKEAHFSPSYERIRDRFEAGWLAAYKELKSRPRTFGHLDAAQLIKHYLGLRHTHPEKRKTLLYLYWEPENANQFPIFRDHKASMDKFKARVAGSGVKFQAQSYLELWRDWEKLTRDRDLLPHVQNLKQRYCLTLQP